MEVDLDNGKDGIEGQGRRSKVKVKHKNYVSQSTITIGQGTKVRVKGQRSRPSRSGTQMKVIQVTVQACVWSRSPWTRSKLLRGVFSPHWLAEGSTQGRFHSLGCSLEHTWHLHCQWVSRGADIWRCPCQTKRWRSSMETHTKPVSWKIHHWGGNISWWYSWLGKYVTHWENQCMRSSRVPRRDNIIGQFKATH